MASKNIYIGDSNGIARVTKKILLGDENGIARTVEKVFYGDENGIARLVYGGSSPYPIPLTPNQLELLKGAYNINNSSLLTVSFFSDAYVDMKNWYDDADSLVLLQGNGHVGWVEDNDVAYFIDSTTNTPYLYNADLSASKDTLIRDAMFSRLIIEGREQLYSPSLQHVLDPSANPTIAKYTLSSVTRAMSGSYGAIARGSFNGYKGVRTVISTLDDTFAILWGSKNVPIYYGSSPSTAVLLPDPSTL